MMKDIPSALSDLSEPIHNVSTDVMLKNLKTSVDSRVTARRIYRLGGLYPTTWMLLSEIGDNTTTEYIDRTNDNQLLLSLGSEVPKGV
jgi:hypothetical protein